MADKRLVVDPTGAGLAITHMLLYRTRPRIHTDHTANSFPLGSVK